MTGQRVGAALLALSWSAIPAGGHPILIHGGSITWTDDELRVMLAADAHLMEHESGQAGDVVTWQRRLRLLADSIHVITSDGSRLLPAEVTECESKRVICRYAVPRGVTALALIHRPDGRLPPLRRQIQLRWSPPWSSNPRLIRLTSGGNHAVMRRGAQAEPGLTDPFAEPVLRIAAADGRGGLGLQIDYPCAVLATWPDLIRSDHDRITVRQFQRCRPAIKRWGRERLLLADRDGAARTWAAERIELIGPSGELLCAGAHSIYTTRVRLQFHDPRVAAGSRATVTWKGFNAAVLGMTVIDARRGQPAVIGVLTPAQPDIMIVKSEE